ncbi:hypothetical protein BDR06DRAFT_962682 [Suillus hirtellus]|nr:hypothetical protein BDR06DRAFT_962682 [Suillus hirtellus]
MTKDTQHSVDGVQLREKRLRVQAILHLDFHVVEPWSIIDASMIALSAGKGDHRPGLAEESKVANAEVGMGVSG